MGVMTRKRLPPPKEACKVCKAALKVGMEYHTTLIEEGKVWRREDYCTACPKPVNNISWKGKVKAVEERHLSCSNEKALEELLQTEEPLWSAFLSEVLLRKGVLRLRGNKFIEVVHTAELVEFDRQNLPLKELPAFHYRLEKLMKSA